MKKFTMTTLATLTACIALFATTSHADWWSSATSSVSDTATDVGNDGADTANSLDSSPVGVDGDGDVTVTLIKPDSDEAEEEVLEVIVDDEVVA